MPATDKGWFDSVAIDYARCRPHYPDAFFAWMADQSPALNCCWDAACGNGQASIGLSRWFNRVEATDLSVQQIAAAEQHPRIHYRQGAAEQSDLSSDSMDAVLIAAAIHWLDVERFNQEVRRVLRPGGLLVWLGYEPIQGAPEDLQTWLNSLYHERLNRFWPPERTHVDTCYANLPFPVCNQPLPKGLRITEHWTQNDLLGFISTWSALRQASQQVDSNDQSRSLITNLSEELNEIWPQDSAQLTLQLPLMGRWGVFP
ncbi:methyltransferase domain protein [Synechococcus sp. BIOS-E4-1]|uniref:methyltransferase domain-containing protein n=1 Tax=Synechococcus sp. BIOS-E4-1 TaxID=1400864 RepID=UPI001648CD53|nr:methyltransferase domain-containing protein [Synechococcus sp. BIOS-E4-1]QNI55469.1 methyltransferase domain protein [Synechococcus sp. BIOS-E4-1]